MNTIMIKKISTGETEHVEVHDVRSEQFAHRLRKTCKERARWARKHDVWCYRVYDADLSDFALSVDIYEGVWKSDGVRACVVSEYQAPSHIDATLAASRIEDALAIVSCVTEVDRSRVFVKTRRKEKGGGQYTDQHKNAFVMYTQECGNVFEVNLGAYLDTGIFLDHRVTRAYVGQLAAHKHFLNLFAYTGTATVHAAVAGAATTTTVDLSATYLAWAQRNMQLNGCIGQSHRFVRADVLAWLAARAHEASVQDKQARYYDLIFIDPPTFSNSKAMGKQTWSVQRDHVQLLTAAASLLAPGGTIVFSCNLRSFKMDTKALAACGISVKDITAQTISHDFERNKKVHCCFVLTKEDI